LQISYGHKIFTQDVKLNRHATVKISDLTKQNTRHEK